MKYSKEKEEGCSYVYEVEVENKDFDNLEQQALSEVQKEASYPGFRKGKVPYEIIKEHFTDAVNEEIKRKAANLAVDQIIEKEKIIPVVIPSVFDIKADFDSKKIKFKVYLEVAPSFEPKDYKGFEIVKKIKRVTDKDVENHMEQIRHYNAYLKPVDAPVSSDKYILVNYEIYENGNKIDEVKNEIIDMSSPQSIMGFEEAVTGAKKGDVREFETEFEGKKLKFIITINDVKEKIVPEIDENMIKQLGAKDLEDLKNQIKTLLENEEKIKAEKSLIEQIENKLIEKNIFPLPPTLVRQEMEELFEVAKKRANIDENQKIDIKDYEDKLRPIAERNLKIAYILHAISKKENINATEQDYQAELDRVIKNLKTQDEINKAKEFFESRKGYILASIVENKTMEFIKSNIKIKEEIVD